MRLVAVVEYPDQLRPILSGVLGRLVGDHQQIARQQRHHGVHEAGIGRRIGPMADRRRLRFVGNIQNEHAAVDIAEIEPVGLLRIDIGVVRAIALVELLARRRRHVVARARARHPPTADLDRLGWIAHINAAVELVVHRVRGFEIGRARGHVHVFAVAEPKLMHAARMLAGGVEEADRTRRFRH